MNLSDPRPWCCTHAALLWYIAVCVTLLGVSGIAEMQGWWG